MASSARDRTAPRSWRTGTLTSLLLAAAAGVALTGASADTPAAAAETPAGVWPLQPRPAVVHTFDPPEVRWGSGHRGVDLQGRVGQPVRAALPGTVSFAGRVAGRGVVVVDHGPTRTTYEPVAASVARGAAVGRGEEIGTLAWFGTHCLPAACLHWGLVAGETYLDPLTLLGGPQPVRLLPLTRTAPLGLWRETPSSRAVAPRPPPGTAAGVAAGRAWLGARVGLEVGRP